MSETQNQIDVAHAYGQVENCLRVIDQVQAILRAVEEHLVEARASLLDGPLCEECSIEEHQDCWDRTRPDVLPPCACPLCRAVEQ